MDHALRVPSTDGVSLALHDLGGEGPPLLLCHPTGFHALTWRPMAGELAASAHCWAPDFRGHGDSTLPSGDLGWPGMADDVLAIVDHLGHPGAGEGPMVAAGHSMGGAALVMAELARPGTFARLWLYEPIIFPPLEGGPAGNPMADAARRRRPWFPDREAAYANYAAKPPLGSLSPPALRAYVDHGFRDAPDGDGVVLKCAPETEAAVFEGAREAHAFERLGDVGSEVVVAVGGDRGGPARVGPLVAEALPKARLERHDHLTHFGPLEAPAEVAAAARAALGL